MDLRLDHANGGQAAHGRPPERYTEGVGLVLRQPPLVTRAVIR